jgi:hypothetical protein
MQRASSQQRRVRVERGIYRSKSGAYEITYTDSAGRQRWQVVSGGVREARAARANVVAKQHRGERVVPSTETFEHVCKLMA